jgi:molybdopterin converting factor small subunit
MPAGVTIKALGHISFLLEASERTVACDCQLPVSSILAQLKESYPLFSEYLGKLDESEDKLLILRADGKELNLNSLVDPGEELILVTPISGG